MHEAAMHRCLELAALGRGRVGNGALVGAALVRGGSIIAEGFHKGFGQMHAERDLLTAFTDPIEPDDILYVNLEPCCAHPTKKNLPCTNFIIERGIRHVVYGMRDPDERVAGQGIGQLRTANIDVRPSPFTVLCEHLNRGFISVRTKGRPWITMKGAFAQDGSIAQADGSPKKITSAEQDVWTHTYLRSQLDAVVVGAQTVINDNPSLDTRLAHEKAENQPEPYRIILDPHLRIPEDVNILTDANRHRTIIVYCSTAGIDQAKRKHLEDSGIRIWDIDMRDGQFDWHHLWELMLAPDDDYHGITSLLVEGGRRTWDLFRKSGMMDEDVVLCGV